MGVVQHAPDGVVWWSPSLLLGKPDWLSEPRGIDVLDIVNWFPVVTFWHLTGDLFVAAGDDIPQGHDADTARLKATVRERLADAGS